MFFFSQITTVWMSYNDSMAAILYNMIASLNDNSQGHGQYIKLNRSKRIYHFLTPLIKHSMIPEYSENDILYVPISLMRYGCHCTLNWTLKYRPIFGTLPFQTIIDPGGHKRPQISCFSKEFVPLIDNVNNGTIRPAFSTSVINYCSQVTSYVVRHLIQHRFG